MVHCLLEGASWVVFITRIVVYRLYSEEISSLAKSVALNNRKWMFTFSRERQNCLAV